MGLMLRSISNWGQAEMDTIHGWNSGIVILTLKMSDLENGSS